MRRPSVRQDLTGRRFGTLLATKRIPRGHLFPGGSYRTTYVCQCDCGKQTEVLSSSLIQENTKSCGCKTAEMISQRKKKRPYENKYNTLKRVANRDNKECSLSYDDFINFTNIKFCEYCEDEIPWQPYRFLEGDLNVGYHLDRKDNNLGYSVENCVVACARCNWAKGALFTYEEWKHIGKSIKEFREGKR